MNLHDAIGRKAFGIAYQLTGSVADAEDLRQEVLLHWLEMEQSGEAARILNPEAYCRRAAANKALNLLRGRNRENYPGEWLPEPLLDDRMAIESRADLGYGFLHLLSLLNAPERAVFLLRESMELSFQDIAVGLDLQEDHCRKLFQRAKERLAARSKPQPVSPAERQRLVAAFIQAVGQGDFAAFQEVLHQDVVVWSDGGGKRQAAMKPIYGVLNAFKFLVGITQKNVAAGMEYALEFRDNGIELLLVLRDARTGLMDTVSAFDIHEGMVHNVYLQRNPEKLGGG